MSLILKYKRCFWCQHAALTFLLVFWSVWLSGITWWRIVAFNIWDLRDNLGNEINSSEDAWVTANCAYLVVIVISVTRPDVLLSCEAAVGKQISYIHPTLVELLWWASMFEGNVQCEKHLYWSESNQFYIQSAFHKIAVVGLHKCLCPTLWLYRVHIEG